MDHLEQLERLNRLRESSGLTQEEYDAEKAKLLAFNAGGKTATVAAPEKSGMPWVIAVGVAIVATISLILFSTLRGQQFSNTSDVADVGNSLVTDNMMEARPTPSPTPTSDMYAWAYDISRLGNNLAYLEQKLGPAKEKDKTQLTFDVGGCEVTYAIKDGAVTSITMPVSSKCQPVVDGRTVGPATTFGSLEKMGNLIASCMGNCGNAADPTIDLYYGGSHADGFIEYYYTGQYDGPTTKAFDLWEAAITKAHGVTSILDVDSELLSCVKSPPAEVVRAMRLEQVRSVEVGYGLNSYCDS